MRELHVVALSEDGRSLVLATTKDARAGGFRVALDPRLTAAVRGDLPRPGEEAVRESPLTPKEIQSRLRAGETPEQIAASAGVPVARVDRFAGPVASECQRIIDQVRAGRVIRGRRGVSILPLGQAVEQHLAEVPSLRPESVEWSTRREEEGTWLVELRFLARARVRTASWRYDPKERSVTAVDADSAAFGHVEDDAAVAQRAQRSAKRSVSKPPARPSAPAAVSATVLRGAGRLGTAVPLQPDGAAKQAPGTATRPTASAAHVASSGVATSPPATVAPAAARTATSPPATPAARTRGRSPRGGLAALVGAAQPAPSPPTKRDTGRPTVPAWADVLLGTAPRPDRGAEG